MYLFTEDQEIPVMVGDIREAAQRIAANCREGRSKKAACPGNCPGLVACQLAGAPPHLAAGETPALRERGLRECGHEDSDTGRI